MATYTLIASYTTTNNTTTVTLSPIPQTYTDLLLRVTERSAVSPGGDPCLIFNGVQTNLSSKRLVGNGGANVYSYTNSGGFVGDGQSGQYMTTNVYGVLDVYIPNYTSSNYKSWYADIVTENNATNSNVYMNLHAGLWSSTAPITSLGMNLNSGSGNFETGCTFYLYGIKNN